MRPPVQACEARSDGVAMVTTETGLQYQDVVPGKGPEPPVGYQVVIHYIARQPGDGGQTFSNTLTGGGPIDVRVGGGALIAGMEEGLRTMKVGGVRRLYIPGPLAFPKGLPAAPGRARVPPLSPVVVDLKLLYIPGFDLDDE